MATYSNQHWLLCHIRNSFISTDDSGMCETVMLSDDLPKHFLRNYNSSAPQVYSGVQEEQAQKQQNRKSMGSNGKSQIRNFDAPLNDDNFVSYPGLDESDDDDMDFSAQSFDIQMYPEVGAHRFRSNTAQKLEKMDIARRKAARTKSVNFDDEIVTPERNDFFQRKDIKSSLKENSVNVSDENAIKVKSRLSLQLENSPKQAQNKFMEYARFDGTSQTSIATKRFNVFLSMLPERERSYPIRICAAANAKIFEVIGLICYKATAEFPELPLKSIRHYALYMTEDNDDLEDFPPLDNREPCSKFGFQYLTLAERRIQVGSSAVDVQQNLSGKSLTSEDERNRMAVRSLNSIELNGHTEDNTSNQITQNEEPLDDYEEQMLSHNDMLEAPLYRTYRLQIIDKRFFKTDVTLGVSGERIEIDQHKHVKFWTKQKAVTYPIDVIAYCEITERRQQKGMLRIWLRASATSMTTNANTTINTNASNVPDGSSTSPSNLMVSRESPFAFITGGVGGQGCIPAPNHHAHMRFKSYDFASELQTLEHINKKLNYILEVRSSEVRREFLEIRERKQEKIYSKKPNKP